MEGFVITNMEANGDCLPLACLKEVGNNAPTQGDVDAYRNRIVYAVLVREMGKLELKRDGLVHAGHTRDEADSAISVELASLRDGCDKMRNRGNVLGPSEVEAVPDVLGGAIEVRVLRIGIC